MDVDLTGSARNIPFVGDMSVINPPRSKETDNFLSVKSDQSPVKAGMDTPSSLYNRQPRDLEVRPCMVKPMTVSDPPPPPLCECEEMGSICGHCKILMDKIISSTASSSSCSVLRTEDETMPQSLPNSSDSAVSSHHLLWTLKQQIILEHLGEYFSLHHVTLRAT